jgi:hypothetical protein
MGLALFDGPEPALSRETDVGLAPVHLDVNARARDLDLFAN